MNKLYSLDPAEVSFVPHGANKKRFMVFKEDGGIQMDKATIEKITKGNPKVMAAIEKVIKDFQEKHDGDLDEKAVTAMKAAARILTPFKDKIPKELMRAVNGATGMVDDDEGEDEGQEPEEKEAMGKVNKEGALGHGDESGQAAEASGGEVPQKDMQYAHKMGVDAYHAARKEAMKKMGHEQYPAADLQMKEDKGDMDEEAQEKKEGEGMVTKSGELDLSGVPEKVRPAVEKIYKDQREAIAKADKLEKDLAEERSHRITKELTEKVEALKHLGAEKTELVSVLKELKESNPKAFEKVEAVLKAADAQIAKGALFAEAGSKLSRASGGTTWEQIEKAAEGYVAKSGEKLSKAEAVEKFLNTQDGQKLYAEHQAQRGGI